MNNYFNRYLWVLVPIYLLTSVPFCIKAQKQGDIWMFGDSAGINFNNLAAPSSISSIAGTVTAAASICDKKGNLLFYTAGIDTGGGGIYTKTNLVMQNGGIDCLNGVTQGLIILPFPNDSSLYYVFSNTFDTTTGNPKLLYNVVDMSLNSGLGSVIKKDILLDSTGLISEIMSAVKHGNGRDWWLMLHAVSNDRFIEFLVSPSGISGPFYQSIGSTLPVAWAQSAFSQDGGKYVFVSDYGVVDIFDFNRCTGVFSNWQDLGEHSSALNYYYYGAAFSFYNNYLYVSTVKTKKTLYQYDLKNTNVKSSKTLIWSLPDSAKTELGLMQLGPDKKIYLAAVSENCGLPYYNNGCYDTFNSYLSVINNPDTIAAACNFTPFSFNLHPGRVYLGLPNMPNYNLGSWTQGGCDTLASVQNIQSIEPSFKIFPNPASTTLTIQPSLSEHPVSISLFNLLGQNVSQTPPRTSSSYSVDVGDLPKGVYIVQVQDLKTGLVGRQKIVVQ